MNSTINFRIIPKVSINFVRNVQSPLLSTAYTSTPSPIVLKSSPALCIPSPRFPPEIKLRNFSSGGGTNEDFSRGTFFADVLVTMKTFGRHERDARHVNFALKLNGVEFSATPPLSLAPLEGRFRLMHSSRSRVAIDKKGESASRANGSGFRLLELMCWSYVMSYAVRNTSGHTSNEMSNRSAVLRTDWRREVL